MARWSFCRQVSQMLGMKVLSKPYPSMPEFDIESVTGERSIL